MAEIKESFKDKLEKMANIVDNVENTFIDKKIKINVEVNVIEFNEITGFLNTSNNQTNCIISIGNVDFIFLKK
jgi:hypothetical protein